MDDILEELTLSELKNLTKMYEVHKQNLPHLYSFLCTSIQALENEMEGYVQVYSPRSCWREDGTFIASMPMHGHDIVMHSLDTTGKNLLEGFRLTKRFKFLKDPARSYTFLYAVHEIFHEKILKIVEEYHKCQIEFVTVLNLWYSTVNNALNLPNSKCPDNVYIKELDPSDVKVIKQHWSYTFPEADLKILDCMKLMKGFGVFLTTTNQMVSWVAPSCLGLHFSFSWNKLNFRKVVGHMTALQTLEDHTGKGYGTLVVKKMTKYLAERGFDNCATVTPGNLAPEAIFQKLGFKMLCQCGFVAISNNQD